jgi:hypothetical protein
MADHSLVAQFNVSASCGNISRDQQIVQQMALAVCQEHTPPENIPPLVMLEASRIYLMLEAWQKAK